MIFVFITFETEKPKENETDCKTKKTETKCVS